MVSKVAVCTADAAEMGGPYAQAVTHNGLIFLSGQGAVDPCTNQVRTGTIEQETRLAMENIRIIMEAAGSSMGNLLQVTAYLRDTEDLTVYMKHFSTKAIRRVPAFRSTSCPLACALKSIPSVHWEKTSLQLLETAIFCLTYPVRNSIINLSGHAH